MLFDQVLLFAVSRFAGNRSNAAIYHLITGRKSIQTIQDAKLFHMQNIYGIYPVLKKHIYDRRIHELAAAGLIRLHNGERAGCSLTEKGHEHCNPEEIPSYHYLLGMAYHETGPVFMKRLFLYVQTFSNTANGNSKFIPIVDDGAAMSWVRTAYRNAKGREAKFMAQLYRELEKILETCTEEEANLFADRLSGHRHIGKSLDQLAIEEGMSVPDVYLVLTAVIHRMLSAASSNSEQFPILTSFASTDRDKQTVSDSAAVTRRLLGQGLGTDQVAAARNLKENTVLDHIVEIALHDRHYSIRPFVSEQEEAQIMNVLENVQSAKLKEIKEAVAGGVTYFQIRLVLARTNHMNEAGAANE